MTIMTMIMLMVAMMMMIVMTMMMTMMMTNIHLLDIVVMVNEESEYSCSKNKELYSEIFRVIFKIQEFCHLNVSRSEEIVPAYLTKTR